MISELTGVIGRDKELKEAFSHINKLRSPLFVGPAGAGKTTVLRQAFKNWFKYKPNSAPLFLPSCKPTKWFFAEICSKLYRRQLLPAELTHLPAPQFESAIRKMHYRDISRLIIQSVKDYPYIVFFLDNLDSITPSAQSLVYNFLESNIVICSTLSSKRGLIKLCWQFQEIPLKPLQDEIIKNLTLIYVDKKNLLIEDKKLFIEHIIYKSAGIPLALHNLLKYFEHEPRIKTADIRKLSNDAGRKEIDLTPIVFVFFGVALALRFVSRAISNKELYIVTSLLCASFIIIRFFAYKGMKADNI